MYDVTKYASQQPFIFLQKAFGAFFKKIAKHPVFKKKGRRDSFYIGGDQIQVAGKKVKIPLLGWVKLCESIRFPGKINGAVVSRSADYWFISFSINTDLPSTLCENQATVGVDLGVKTLATLSTGEEIPGNAPLRRYLRKLKRQQRILSRRVKGSKNRLRAKRNLAKLHFKISCLRQDQLHKLTTHLTSNFRHIAIEDLDVSSMLKKRHMARHIADMGFYEFRRQLTYKAEWCGNNVVLADRWFPSSKTCSRCGHVKDILKLSERSYECLECGLEIGRDLNAALVLEKLIKNTVSSTGIDACGQDGSVLQHCAAEQPAWQKQELSPV